jgi:biotin transporter BioY
MFWPLAGGFIAFLIIVVLIGWAVNRSEERARGQ